MIIGNGLVASSFSRYKQSKKILIFASGVSNSKNHNVHDYNREKNLLLQSVKDNPNMIFVYFSTCSVYDSDLSHETYVNHKLDMESLLISSARKYLIFRLSNLVGKTNNANTIVNYLYNKIDNDEHFQLWANAFRNVIDVEDAELTISYIMDNSDISNEIINIANPKSYLVSDMVSRIEKFLNKKACYTFINKGTLFSIDTSYAESVYEHLNINFSKNYFERLLEKYYS